MEQRVAKQLSFHKILCGYPAEQNIAARFLTYLNYSQKATFANSNGYFWAYSIIFNKQQVIYVQYLVIVIISAISLST